VYEGETAYGVLVLWSNTESVIDDDEFVTARIFARALATALGRAELFAELASRNKEIDERSAIIRDLVYALTHDLRTPLTALGMTMRQARDQAYGELPQQSARILNASISAIDDLQRLAETLLTVARIESGELRTARDPIALQKVIADVVTEFGALAESRDIEIRTDAHIQATILGDRGDIRRAITNLVANAIEHTPEHGCVELNIEQRGNSILVHVLDNGYGIPPELQSTLFERFAAFASPSGRGTGLGLYIVRRIAEAASGTVTYTPRSPRGSIFTLSFPNTGT
jgi:signal transduction histidine kinase